MTTTDKVRLVTRAQHEALDSALMPHLAAIRSKDAYIVLLRAFYGFFKPVYDKIDAFLDLRHIPDYPQRRKPAVILADLAALGAAFTSPVCLLVPPIASAEQALGALYVLEGSTMGGVMIRKMLASQLSMETGLQFFAGYGKNTREQWMQFVQFLNNVPLDAAGGEAVAATAAATFSLFKDWLQQARLPVLQQAGASVHS